MDKEDNVLISCGIHKTNDHQLENVHRISLQLHIRTRSWREQHGVKTTKEDRRCMESIRGCEAAMIFYESLYSLG